MHWLWWHAGLESGDNPWYLWWSGFGAIVLPPLLTAVPIVWVLLRKHNCHVHGCWRIGRHPVEGTGFMVCRHHDPSGKVTAAQVRERYHLHLGKKVGQG